MIEIRKISLLLCVLVLGTTLFSQELQKDNKLFVGVNFGVGLGAAQTKGYGQYSPYKRTNEFIIGNVGIDIAYETIEDIFVGVYSAVGTDFKIETQHFDLGALLLLGINKSTSLILGAGTHSIDYKYNGCNLRIGVLSPRNVSIMLEVNYNYRDNYKYYQSATSKTTVSALISFGYRIF